MEAKHPDHSQWSPVSDEEICASLNEAGVDFIVTVPDWVQISVHQRLSSDPLWKGRIISCCTEDEALVVAAGLHVAGHRPLVMMQNQGLYACVNALRAIGLDAGLPLVMMIGQFGREPENRGKPHNVSRRRVVRLLQPMLGVLDVPFCTIEKPADVQAIAQSFVDAELKSWPHAIIIGNNTVWSSPRSEAVL